LTQPTVY